MVSMRVVRESFIRNIFFQVKTVFENGGNRKITNDFSDPNCKYLLTATFYIFLSANAGGGGGGRGLPILHCNIACTRGSPLDRARGYPLP